MIPTDLASRISLQNGTSVLPLAAAKEVGAELPPYTPGSRITAQVVAARMDGQFRVLVEGNPNPLLLSFANPNDQGQSKASGKTGTAAPSPLAGRIAPGDTLQLTVVARAPGTIFASAHSEATSATISRSGRMISDLLGRSDRQPAPLASGQPLLSAQPKPEDFASLPGKLRQSVAESGLFYESHQAQWVTGKRDVTQLSQEPHNRLAATAGLPPALAGHADSRHSLVENPAGATAGQTPSAPTGSSSVDASLPAPLQPLVQQQLDAAATREVTWVLQPWPGQTAEWQVSERRDAAPDYAADELESRWRTSLKLTLPHLGRIEASLHLSGHDLQLRLLSDGSGSQSESLSRALPLLAQALAGAGLSLQSAAVQSFATGGASP